MPSSTTRRWLSPTRWRRWTRPTRCARSSGSPASREVGERGARMLYAFGFDRVGVLVSDLYFIDPRPLEGQESAERGVRLEVRMLDRGAGGERGAGRDAGPGSPPLISARVGWL